MSRFTPVMQLKWTKTNKHLGFFLKCFEERFIKKKVQNIFDFR